MITLYSLTRIPARFLWPYKSKPVKIKPGIFSKAQLAKQINSLIIVFHLNQSEQSNKPNLDYVVNYIKDKYSWISQCHILVGDVPHGDDTLDNLPEFEFYRNVQAALPDIPVTLYHPQNLNGELAYADSWLYEWLIKFVQAKPNNSYYPIPSKDEYAHPILNPFMLDFRGHNYEFYSKLSCLINQARSERSYLAALLWDLDCKLTYRDSYVTFPRPKFEDKVILKKYKRLLPAVSKHFMASEVLEGPDHLAVTMLQSLRIIEKGFCNVIIDDPYWSHVPRITEKTCKPMLATRPWIFAGAYHTLAWLQEQGFKTFSRWWDESYDQEPNHWRRLEKVYRTAEFVNSLSVSDCNVMLTQMQPILEHNYLHLTKKFVHRTTANLFK